MDELELARDHLGIDRCAATRAEIDALVAAGDRPQLRALLGGRLAFGTAGLRARMGAGSARMNELTVLQAAQGVCAHILAPRSQEPGSANRPADPQIVVVAHDHRRNSLAFARIAAAAFLAKGVPVAFFGPVSHTPLVPFAVRHLAASAGIMITASHNPKDDNGFKLYASNACQIIPPLDKRISELILQNLEPWTWDLDLVYNSQLASDPLPRIWDAYFDRIQQLSVFRSSTNPHQHVKICYTAMHGVGFKPAAHAFHIFGLTPFIPVPEQIEPDPEFPTVEYPNPEEGEGALLLAMKCAESHGATLILANDPDADRLAVAERHPDGHWHIFNGNEIGVILASFVLESINMKGGPKRPLAMLSTTVSSHMLKQMAKQEGFYFEETLTGFKWLGNRALELEADGFHVAFAYEEAIGFMVGDIVRDKDGISALAVIAEWANHLASKGKTLHGHLLSLYEKYGFFASRNGYVICNQPDVINKLFDTIRYGENPKPTPTGSQYPYTLKYPDSFGGSRVVWVRDLTIGYDSNHPDHRPTLPVSASSQMLTFELENGALITLRTSGTEPKIKYYTELRANTLEIAKRDLDIVVESMIAICLNSQKNKFA